MLIPTSIFVLLCTAGAAVLGLLLAGLIGATIDKGLHSSDVAGWVQAIGATLGLAIAVWLPFKQKQEAEARELALSRDSARRVRLAFLDELTFVRSSILTTNVASLLSGCESYFKLEIPIPSQKFPIYSALGGRITELDDDELRQSVIAAYANVSSLIDIVKMHNRQLIECLDIKTRIGLSESESLHLELNKVENRLSETTSHMRSICRASIDKTCRAIELLEQSLGNPVSA